MNIKESTTIISEYSKPHACQRGARLRDDGSIVTVTRDRSETMEWTEGKMIARPRKRGRTVQAVYEAAQLA